MENPTVERVCKERCTNAAELLSALLNPIVLRHRVKKGFGADAPAALKLTIIDDVRQVLRSLGCAEDQPGTMLELLALIAVKQLEVYGTAGFPAAEQEQNDVVYLIRELIREAEAEGKKDRQRGKKS